MREDEANGNAQVCHYVWPIYILKSAYLRLPGWLIKKKFKRSLLLTATSNSFGKLVWGRRLFVLKYLKVITWPYSLISTHKPFLKMHLLVCQANDFKEFIQDNKRIDRQLMQKSFMTDGCLYGENAKVKQWILVYARPHMHMYYTYHTHMYEHIHRHSQIQTRSIISNIFEQTTYIGVMNKYSHNRQQWFYCFHQKKKKKKLNCHKICILKINFAYFFFKWKRKLISSNCTEYRIQIFFAAISFQYGTSSLVHRMLIKNGIPAMCMNVCWWQTGKFIIK